MEEKACSRARTLMTVRHYSASWSPTLILIDVNVLVYAHRADTGTMSVIENG
jgi:hypothetical protein